MSETRQITNRVSGATAKTASVGKTAMDYLQGDSFKRQLAMALPKHLDTDRFVRSAMSEFRLNPMLQTCTVPSVLGFFMQAAMCGLEPGSVLGQCYAVPFNNRKTNAMEAQFILGYRGMASIARRSGEVMSIDAHIVYTNDQFELTYGLEQKLVHVPCIDVDPGAVRGAYCVVRFRDGSYQYQFMPVSEIDKHRARSKASSSGPWVTDYEEMCKKTVFRALFKWLPISIEDMKLAQADEVTAKYTGAGSTSTDAEDFVEISFANDEGDESNE